MLCSQDLRRLASVVDPQSESQFLKQETLHETCDYNVEHLDYHYVSSCKDVDKLRMLLDVLKSGREGSYPALEEAILLRIETLHPHLKRITPLSAEQAAKVTSDVATELNEWAASIGVHDAKLSVSKTHPKNTLSNKDIDLDGNNSGIGLYGNDDSGSVGHHIAGYADTLPAIRGTTSLASTSITNSAMLHTERETRVDTPINAGIKPLLSSASKNPDRIRSSDYRAWDKFDVKSELARVDEQMPPQKRTSTDTPSAHAIPSTCIKSSAVLPSHARSTTQDDSPPRRTACEMDTSVSVYQATMEKFKGNECFKAGEFSEALEFYNRSLSLCVSVHALTNRAATYLKLHDYESAEMDATHAISLNDSEMMCKAYLRRAQARTKRAKYTEALSDFDIGVSLCDCAPHILKQLQLEREKCIEAYRNSYGDAAHVSDSGAGISVNAASFPNIGSLSIGSYSEPSNVGMMRDRVQPTCMIIEEISDDEDENTPLGAMDIPPAAEKTSSPKSVARNMNIVDVDDELEDADEYEALVFE
ncbi:hypothetical protein BASA50_002565 [Batrachochytrium salamandrivorans]|uniref:RNA-polymerase II-associated protein 3-like C-terminal domain-containing protein n=1 Tax=Batrachochytrium salamandrivorans TaxID=1357716 RepID=A0ABQ8FP07_9FUNG|nr:hypothetical protein BASA60_008371 [Batrachochytrium salamandrivorans]KAH6579005.1 hypothetical protein BASA61_010534 [Batrachochytrium salamandrivorans]KAH6600106.1 hypothetical protein BASA50_002565 [Batrachochytrium salamandrivorans]KAH9250224.1 hypothetical protein BASA81_011967 [Batrachochytrium salamandrivorans]KAH9266028.1 hypothetical protein BASA84_001296 [Batrachochytrium salamandrivorans]